MQRSVAATESAPSQSLSLSHAELTAKLTNRDFQDSIHSHRRQAVKSHRGVNKKAGGATTTDDGVIVALAESLSSTNAADEFVEELLRPASVAGVVSLRASKPNDAAKTKTLHYGTKPGHFETSKIHLPTSEGVSEVSERANERAQRRARAKQAVRSQRTSERCERMDE